MARKEISEIKEWRAKPEGEIRKHVADLRERLWSLKADLAQGKVKNVREITRIKRFIAQLLTVERERERGGVSGNKS